VSYGTGRTDLLDLAKHHLLTTQKSGRTFTFVAPADLRARLTHISVNER
jgi:hypothetical protein